jgi:phosphonatase-like hydrolase
VKATTHLPIDLVVLDMAGTTIDEGEQVYRVLAETVRAHGGTPTDADISRWHGAAKREALRALLVDPAEHASDGGLNEIVDEFRSRLKTAYRENPPRPFPQVENVLRRLRAEGIRVALTTGFDHEILEALLDVLGWHGDSIVDAVVCGSDVPRGRPAPYMIFRAMERLAISETTRVLVAGDTPRDLESGTNAGAGFVVGVLSGAGTAEELGRHRHTHLVRSVTDIPQLIGLS